MEKKLQEKCLNYYLYKKMERNNKELTKNFLVIYFSQCRHKISAFVFKYESCKQEERLSGVTALKAWMGNEKALVLQSFGMENFAGCIS